MAFAIDSLQHLRPGILFFRGFLALLFAAFCLAAPGLTLMALTFTIAAYLAADGIVSLFLQTPGERPLRSWFWSVASGGAGIAAGALMFFFPQETTVAIGILAGIWAVSLGVFQVLGAIDASNSGSTTAKFTLGLSGFLCTGLGLAILTQPWIGVIALLSLLAFSTTAIGIASIVIGFQISKSKPAAHRPLRTITTTPAKQGRRAA